eukprot:2980069-Pyramimonas_sp.AAC.1
MRPFGVWARGRGKASCTYFHSGLSRQSPSSSPAAGYASVLRMSSIVQFGKPIDWNWLHTIALTSASRHFSGMTHRSANTVCPLRSGTGRSWREATTSSATGCAPGGPRGLESHRSSSILDGLPTAALESGPRSAKFQITA